MPEGHLSSNLPVPTGMTPAPTPPAGTTTPKVPWRKFEQTPAYDAMQKTLATYKYKLVIPPTPPGSTAEPVAYIVNIT